MTGQPMRIQLSRRKGWRMPPNTVSVSRPGRWGNIYKPGPAIDTPYCRAPAVTIADCVRMHRERVERSLEGAFAEAFQAELETLRGRSLACWCALCAAHADGKPFTVRCSDCAPCHADALGHHANRPILKCEAA
jgi:hypothetical protein